MTTNKVSDDKRRPQWEARKAMEKESHWTIWCDGSILFTCWTGEADARAACDAHNASLRSAERAPELVALDELCKASGYQRWWVQRGKLFLERDGDPGRIQVFLVTSLAPSPEQQVIQENEENWRAAMASREKMYAAARAAQSNEAASMTTRHKACPDPDDRCQHGDDINCPKLGQEQERFHCPETGQFCVSTHCGPSKCQAQIVGSGSMRSSEPLGTDEDAFLRWWNEQEKLGVGWMLDKAFNAPARAALAAWKEASARSARSATGAGKRVEFWIAVAKAKPETRTRVLISNGLLVEVGYIDFDGEWRNDQGFRFVMNHAKPTHWQPLPDNASVDSTTKKGE